MTLELDAIRPDDANEMIRLARENGQGTWHYSEGAHGTVVRGEGCIRGFCLLRETPVGFVVDELWCDRSREGIAAIGLLSKWLETTMRSLASDRAANLNLAGIVRLDNPIHKRALVNRGYRVIAEVLVKEFPFEEVCREPRKSVLKSRKAGPTGRIGAASALAKRNQPS